MKKFNYITGQYEDDGTPDFLGELFPVKMNEQSPQIEPIEKKINSVDSKPMNPVVKDFIMKKLESKKEEEKKLPSFMDQFSEAEYKKVKDASEADNGSLSVAQFVGGLGDAIAGRSPDATAQRFDNIRQRIKENTLGDFETRKKNAIQDYSTKRELEQNKLTDEQRSREMDINSEESKMAQALAIKMGVKPEIASKMSAAKFKEVSPVMEKMYAVEQNRLTRQDSKEQREYEKNQTLETTYGTARTADDAKQLKGAAETKTKFDRQLKELIELRKNRGVEYWDREDVGRANQLSKDLLLGYKDLAKLGVLSDKDTHILNAIIPEDPLGQDWAPGQDAILHKLQKFQGDIESDFNARLNQRLKDPKNQKRQAIENTNQEEAKIESFMEKNNISDRDEAIRILKEHGKI